MTFEIYGLYRKDRPDDIRYIGVTKNGTHNRFRGHRYSAVNNAPQPVSQWIRKHGIDAIGWRVLATATTREDMLAAEVVLIAEARKNGVNLLNVYAGGQATPEQLKRIMYASRSGNRASLVQTALELRLRTPSERAKASVTPKQRAAAAENGRVTGRRERTERERALLSAAHKGRSRTAAERKAISEGVRRANERRDRLTRDES